MRRDRDRRETPKAFNVLAFIIICIFTQVPCYSKEYRISRNGGSFTEQLSVILSKGELLPVNETITIRIDEGYYPIDKPIEINGYTHRLVLIGRKCHKTIISGSVRIEGWEVLASGLWRGKVPKVGDNFIPDQLYANGVRLPRACTPNKDAFVLQDGIKQGSFYGAVLKDEDFNLVAPVTEDDIPILSIYRKWTVSKRYLSKTDPSKNTLFFSGIGFPKYNQFTAGNKMVVENTIAGIDRPGEWCVDINGYIYYMPQEGDILNKTEFRIPIIDNLFIIQSAAGIQLKNLVFEHTSYQLPVEGSEFGQAASKMSAAIEIDNVKGFAFENCEIRNIANYGIWLRKACTESIVKKTYFHDLGAGAIKIGSIEMPSAMNLTNHITIDNNIIHHYGVLMENAVGIILFHAADCSITHNDVRFGDYSGISIGWVWGYGNSFSKNNEVAYNKISNIGEGSLNDLGGIYTLGKSEGTHIHHNVISDISSSNNMGWGIYADEGTTGIVVDNNLVFNCVSGGFHQHYGSDNIISNNIFAWGERSQFTLTSVREDHPLTFTHNIILMSSGALLSGGGINSEKYEIGGNCYWTVSSDIPKVGKKDVTEWLEQRDTTSVFQDPLFEDAQFGDFRFKKKTICKAIGFEVFDYTKAGVYGKRKWRKLSETND